MASTAWEPDKQSGYGNHEYRKIDPDTINPEDYARGLRGEEKYLGDVREYNTAGNSKHPDTNMDLYDLGLLGTRFKTDAEGLQGPEWEVVEFPRVKGLLIETVLRVHSSDGEPIAVDTVRLGLVVGPDNLFRQVVTSLVKRGMIDREQRASRLLGSSNRQRLLKKADESLGTKS